MTKFEGGCQCGAVRYAFEAERLLGYCCHCRECRKQSASAFGLSVPMRADRLRWSGTDPHRWERPAHSGHVTVCLFCSACGGRLVHQDAVSPEYVSIKAGGLDDIDRVAIVGHLWTIRRVAALPLELRGETFETQPDELASWRRALVDRMLGS